MSDTTHTTTLQLVVEMIANGRGHAVTKAQIKELQAEMDALNAKAVRNPTESLRLANIQTLLTGLNGAEGTSEAKKAGEKMGEQVAKALADSGSKGEAKKIGERLSQQVATGLKSSVESASKAGDQIGDEVGKKAGKHLEEHLKKHIANVAGHATGVHGLGGLFTVGGMAGAGAAVGIAILEKTIQAVVAKFYDLREEMKATQDLVERLSSAKVFSAENLHQLTEVAERMHNAKHSTTEWLKVIGELTRVGADPATMGPMTEDVQRLAKLMGGDMVGATKTMVDALQGEYAGLKQVNIVLADNLSKSEAMGQIHEQIGLRVSEFGNAAVSAVPQLKQLEEAEKGVARQTEGIKDAADRAAAAVGKMVAEAEKLKSDKLRKLDAEEQLAVDEEERKFAEHHQSREQADKNILEIRKRFAADRIAVQEAAVKDQEATRAQAVQDAKAAILRNEEEVRDQKARAEAAARIEAAQGKVAEAKKNARRVDDFGSASGAISDSEAELLDRYKKSKFLSDDDRESQKDLARRLKKFGLERDVQQRVHEAEAALAEAEKNAPADLKGRAVEQAKANAAEKSLEERNAPYYKAIEDNTEALRELKEGWERLKEILTIEGKDKATQAQTKAAQDAEARNKQLEAEAKSYQRRAQEAREKGYPEPEMPRDLRGRSWEWDEFNDRFRWVRPEGQRQQNGSAARGMKETASAIGDAAAGIEELVNQAVALKTTVAQAVSRMKNDGGRIG